MDRRHESYWVVTHSDGRRWSVRYDDSVGASAMPDRYRWHVRVGHANGRLVDQGGKVHRMVVNAIRESELPHQAIPQHTTEGVPAPTVRATSDQIREQAQAVSTLADSIASGRLVGPRYAAVKRLADMVDTLTIWIGDDR